MLERALVELLLPCALLRLCMKSIQISEGVLSSDCLLTACPHISFRHFCRGKEHELSLTILKRRKKR